MTTSNPQSQPIGMQELFSVRGKTALVTGGSRGIGLMIARGYVEAGAGDISVLANLPLLILLGQARRTGDHRDLVTLVHPPARELVRTDQAER